MVIINVFSLILSIVAVVYLIYITAKTAKGLRTGFLLLTLSILIGLAIHSLAEALERFGFLSMDLLAKIMPTLVLLGSFLALTGTYILYKTLKKVSEKIKKG